MQILTPPPEAPCPPQLMAHHPFVLEYPMRAYRTPDLRFRRRRKNAIEWAWVLNALLHGSIKYSSSRPKQMWAIRTGDVDSPCFWAQEFYIVPGYRGFADVLSEQAALLPVVPADAYFSDMLSPAHAGLPLDTFSIPDNLDKLVGAFRPGWRQATAILAICGRHLHCTGPLGCQHVQLFSRLCAGV
jgi:hypothetical protein